MANAKRIKLSMALKPLQTTKKTFYYNFLPSKREEDYLRARRVPARCLHGRVLVEMRDIYPPSPLAVREPGRNPWVMYRTLDRSEVAAGRILVSFSDTFEYILRHWDLSMANLVVRGYRVSVTLWDVTDEKKSKKYERGNIHFDPVGNNDCVIFCMEWMRDKKLMAGDTISFFWDSGDSSFKFKFLGNNASSSI